jgi:hypothetical protein
MDMSLSGYKMILIALGALAGPKHADPKFEVLGYTTGEDTKVEFSYLGLIETKAAWVDLWESHKGPAEFAGLANGDAFPPPELDFKKQMVLAFYMGQQRGVTGFTMATPQVTDKAIILNLTATYLPTSTPVLTHPYALIQVTPVKKPIEVKVSLDGTNFRRVGAVSRSSH